MKRAICIVLILALLSSVCFAVANAYSYPLVGSTESTVYHYSDCSYANNIKQENRITFIDAQDAVNRGYHPCTRCNPPQPGGTITPTVKPSATPSPTPTSKPTVTPTPSATAKPTENPTVTAKPTTTPTTTLTPSPTATSTQTSQPTPTPTSTANPTNLPSATPISTPITTGTPDAISPIDPTPQPQIISQSPAPSVPELGIPSLLIILMLASILALFSKRWQRKRL